MNLSKNKVKYICERNEDLGIEDYFKRVYLIESGVWGVKKKITKATFDKRKNEGYEVEYYNVTFDFSVISDMIIDINSLLYVAEMTFDEEWIKQLERKKDTLINLLK